MTTDNKKGLENILQSLENYIEPSLDKLRYDKTYRAKVIAYKGTGIYTVQINGKQYDMQTNVDDLTINSMVHVKAPLNNFSDIYLEAGGAGGSSDYTTLDNKPQINSVELVGNKSLHDLGIQPEGQYVIDNDYVHTDNNYTDADKAIVDSYTVDDVLAKIKTVDGTGSGLDADLLDGLHASSFELVSNKVTSISAASTNTQYPSAKLLYDQLVPINNNINSLLNERTLTGEPTGFTNSESIIVNYNSTIRQITLTGTFEAYYRGVLVPVLTNGWVSPAHAAVNGTYYLYYDGSTFQFTTTPWTFDKIQIAFVQYGTNNFAIKETHGFMQWQAHKEFHQTVGAYKESGGEFTSFVLDSVTPINRRPNISALIICDEDLRNVINALTTKVYTVRTLTGSAVRTLTTNYAEILPVNGTIPYYNLNTNGTWTQEPMTNNNYAAVFVVGIPTTSDAGSQLYRYMFIQPQRMGTLAEIQGLSPADLILGDVSNFVSEFVFIAKIIINYTGNDWKITSIANITGNVLSVTSSPTTAHNSLGGLQGGTIGEYYHITSTQVAVVANTSGTNTGDETASTIKTKLGITTLSGSNTGDQTTITGNAGSATKLETPRAINGVNFDGTAPITIVDTTKEPIITKKTGFNLDLSTTATDIKMNGTQALGTLSTLPRADHVHPSDTTKVPTTRTVAGKALSANITLVKADVGLGNVDNTADVNKPVATQSVNGIMSSTDKTKLDGVATGATNYVHPATHSADMIVDGTTNKTYTAVEKTKLAGIATGAQVNNITDLNATDLTDTGATTLHYHTADRDRANHTGTQTASTINDWAANVRSTILTGLSTATNAVITATDTVLTALGLLQKQISDNLTAQISGLGTKRDKLNTYTTTTTVTEGFYRIATIPIGTPFKNVMFKVKGITATGTTTESTITVDLAYYSGSYSNQITGIFANTSHSNTTYSAAEAAAVLYYCRVSFNATSAYIDLYKYKSTIVTIETQPLIENDWVWATGALTVNPTVGSYRTTQVTLTSGQSGNSLVAASASSATSSTYSTYGTLGSQTLTDTVNKTGLWEPIGTWTILYNSSYLRGHSGNVRVRMQELSYDGSITPYDLDDFSLNIKANLGYHADAATFNTLVPTFGIEIDGKTSLAESDFAAVVTASSTTTKTITFYIKLKSNNTMYCINPEERYGRSFATSTYLQTTAYCYFSYLSGAATLVSLPTPIQGLIANATKKSFDRIIVPDNTDADILIKDGLYCGSFLIDTANSSTKVAKAGNILIQTTGVLRTQIFTSPNFYSWEIYMRSDIDGNYNDWDKIMTQNDIDSDMSQYIKHIGSITEEQNADILLEEGFYSGPFTGLGNGSLIVQYNFYDINETGITQLFIGTGNVLKTRYKNTISEEIYYGYDWTPWTTCITSADRVTLWTGSQSTGNITAALSNYSRIGIYYQSNDGYCSYVEVDYSLNAIALLQSIAVSANAYIKSMTATLTASSLNLGQGYECNVLTHSITAFNSIIVTKIVGFKY